jgi:hypothetical protein
MRFWQAMRLRYYVEPEFADLRRAAAQMNLSDSDIERLINIYGRGITRGANFAHNLSKYLHLLSSPFFLFSTANEVVFIFSEPPAQEAKTTEATEPRAVENIGESRLTSHTYTCRQFDSVLPKIASKYFFVFRIRRCRCLGGDSVRGRRKVHENGLHSRQVDFSFWLQ